MRDDYCDGLGDCLPTCPMDAIHFVEREAAAYDAAAVEENKRKKQRSRRWRHSRFRADVREPGEDDPP